MNIRSVFAVVAAACTAVALTVAMTVTANEPGETVRPNFEHVIPDIPGKSLTAVVIDSGDKPPTTVVK